MPIVTSSLVKRTSSPAKPSTQRGQTTWKKWGQALLKTYLIKTYTRYIDGIISSNTTNCSFATRNLTSSSSSDMAASASVSFFLWNQVRLLTEETPGFKAVRRASSSDSCDTSNTLIRPSAPPVANRSGLVGWNFTKVIRYTYSGRGRGPLPLAHTAVKENETTVTVVDLSKRSLICPPGKSIHQEKPVGKRPLWQLGDQPVRSVSNKSMKKQAMQ